MPTCPVGSLTGFPLQINPFISIYDSSSVSQDVIDTITIPVEYSFNWAPTAPFSMSIQRSAGATGLFQIKGFDAIASGTTISLGGATYSCSNIMSIVQNQHSFACADSAALYELILAFQIQNKTQNQSSPDIILMCRPLVFTNRTNDTSDFWPSVYNLTTRPSGSTRTATLNLSSLFAYDSTTPRPMVTYTTCMPYNLVGSPSVQNLNISVAVNIVGQPIYLNVPTQVSNACAAITKYTLATSTIFPNFVNVNAGQYFQFTNNGYSNPATRQNNYIMGTPRSISASEISRYIQLQVPEGMLGQSLEDINSYTATTLPKSVKKQYKCYTINPDTDIDGDKILIDPTNGKPLRDSVIGSESSGRLPIETPPPGLSPGEIQDIVVGVFIFIFAAVMIRYAIFIWSNILLEGVDYKYKIGHIVGFILIISTLISLSLVQADKI